MRAHFLRNLPFRHLGARFVPHFQYEVNYQGPTVNLHLPAPRRLSTAPEKTLPWPLRRFAVGGKLAGKREQVVGDLLIRLWSCFLAVRETLKMSGDGFHRPDAV